MNVSDRRKGLLLLSLIASSALVVPFIASVLAVGSAVAEFSGNDVTTLNIRAVAGDTIVMATTSINCANAGPATAPTVSLASGSSVLSIGTSTNAAVSEGVNNCPGDGNMNYIVSMFSWVAQPLFNPGVNDQDKITLTGCGDYCKIIVLAYAAGPFAVSDHNAVGAGTSTTPAVSSFTPDGTYTIIAFYAWCTTATGTATPTAGTGFALTSSSIAQSAICSAAGAGEPGMVGETNSASGAQTCPLTLSRSSVWRGVCASLPAAANALPISCVTDNGATSATITLTQSQQVSSTTHAPEPATFTCPPSSTYGKLFYSQTSKATNNIVTATVPSDGTNTRYRYQVSSAESTTTTYTTDATNCKGDYCLSWHQELFYELKNTISITPSSPTTWDASRSICVEGSEAGLNVDLKCFTPAAGSGAQTFDAWSDYNTKWYFEPSTGGTLGTVWYPATLISSAFTTGGNTVNSDYSLIASTVTTTTVSTTSTVSVTSTTTSTTTSVSTTTETSGGTTTTVNVNISDPPNFDWLPFGVIGLLILVSVVAGKALKKRR